VGGDEEWEASLIYLRVQTCSGADARLSVGCSAPPGPLRVVNRTVYLLPGSRDLSEGERRTGMSGGLWPALHDHGRGLLHKEADSGPQNLPASRWETPPLYV
jgi:hypothetical protein